MWQMEDAATKRLMMKLFCVLDENKDSVSDEGRGNGNDQRVSVYRSSKLVNVCLDLL